jgi:uncharacterized protein
MEIKASHAPLYQNKSTVESVDLLMQYDVGPFVKRIYSTPTMMVVAEGDDLTLWDLEIGAFNQIPSPRKKLNIIPHTTHMKLYSDQAKLRDAASLARDWFVETL